VTVTANCGSGIHLYSDAQTRRTHSFLLGEQACAILSVLQLLKEARLIEKRDVLDDLAGAKSVLGETHDFETTACGLEAEDRPNVARSPTHAAKNQVTLPNHVFDSQLDPFECPDECLIAFNVSCPINPALAKKHRTEFRCQVFLVRGFDA
jgi:hypothetical protein